MREENFGPVAYHCGGQMTNRAPECELDYPHVAHDIPSDLTRAMLSGTGRDPDDFVLQLKINREGRVLAMEEAKEERLTPPITRAFALLALIARHSNYKWTGSYEFNPSLPESWQYVILYNEDQDDKLTVYGNGDRHRT